jgi:hypothetical protein
VRGTPTRVPPPRQAPSRAEREGANGVMCMVHRSSPCVPAAMPSTRNTRISRSRVEGRQESRRRGNVRLRERRIETSNSSRRCSSRKLRAGHAFARASQQGLTRPTRFARRGGWSRCPCSRRWIFVPHAPFSSVSFLTHLAPHPPLNWLLRKSWVILRKLPPRCRVFKSLRSTRFIAPRTDPRHFEFPLHAQRTSAGQADRTYGVARGNCCRLCAYANNGVASLTAR